MGRQYEKRLFEGVGGRLCHGYQTNQSNVRKNLATSVLNEDYVPPKGNIRLPESDDQWKAVKAYVNEPGPEYRHASESAFEAFRDIKYGVRIHWGLYSTQGVVGH